MYVRQGRVARVAIAAVIAASMVAFALASTASASVVVGCTWNVSTHPDPYDFYIHGYMTGCPYGNLYVSQLLMLNGNTVAGTFDDHSCQNTTGCGLPTSLYSACWVRGYYTSRVHGVHGNADDYADISWTVTSAAASASSCSAAQVKQAQDDRGAAAALQGAILERSGSKTQVTPPTIGPTLWQGDI